MPKISELNSITSLLDDDLLAVAHDIGGIPSTRKIKISDFANTIAAGINSAVLPSTNRSEGYLLTWDEASGEAIWQPTSPVYGYVINASDNNYNIQKHDGIIFVDPSVATGDITMILPESPDAVPGKSYIIKNIHRASDYIVRVVTATNSINIEDSYTGNITDVIELVGDTTLSVVYDGVYWRSVNQSIPRFYTSANTFAQVTLQNRSNSNNASSDFVAYNDAGDVDAGTGPFIDIGIDSSTYSNTTYGNVWRANDSYVYNANGNLIIGPSTDHTIKFIAGGTNNEDVRMTVNSSYITVNSNIHATNPYFDLYATSLAEISASTNGNGGGDETAYVWAYRNPGYAESGQFTSNSTAYSQILHTNDGIIAYNGENSTDDYSWAYTIGSYNSNSIALIYNSKEWIFNKVDGSLTLPGGLNLPMGYNTGWNYNYNLNGPTLNLSNDPTQQVIITGPTANTIYPNSQRIIIQGKRGFGSWGQNIAGEGGDVYLWGGVGGESDIGGGTGGDIKVRGGQGQANSGGYVRIEAGDAAHWNSDNFGSGGFIDITAGDVLYSGNLNNYGGSINISAGKAYDNVYNSGTITLSTGSTTYSNSSREQWVFGNDGILTLPGTIQTTGTEGNVVITSSDGYDNFNWNFANNGILTLPDHGKIIFNSANPEQYIEGTQGFHIYASDSVSISVEANTWSFGHGGALTLPGSIIGTAVDSVYVDTTIELDTTATINKLYPQAQAGSAHYHLADGSEGQIMYIVPATGGEAVSEYTTLNISHARYSNDSGASAGVINEVTDAVWWLPFRTGATSLTLIFTDGHWNLPHAVFD